MAQQVAERAMQELDGEARAGAGIGRTAAAVHAWRAWCREIARAAHSADGLFEDLMKWAMGVRFRIAAFPDVMSQLLGGGTVHRACGIPA
eukprot:9491801-Pyramimonas_sp.AAC.1